MLNADSIMSKKELDELDITLLTKKQLIDVQPGDFIEIDLLHQSLLHAGYNASYENVWSGTSGFFALIYIDDAEIGAVEGDSYGHMVKSWYFEEYA